MLHTLPARGHAATSLQAWKSLAPHKRAIHEMLWHIFLRGTPKQLHIANVGEICRNVSRRNKNMIKMYQTLK